MLNVNITYIFQSIKCIQDGVNLQLEQQIEGNVFKLYREENSNHNSVFFGTLVIGETSQKVRGTYRIYRTIGKFNNGNNTNANMGQMLLDLNLFFDPLELNCQEKLLFLNPLELIIIGAYINQYN